MSHLSDIRKEYLKGSISVESMPSNPLEALKAWVDQAIESKVHEPTAMNIATVSAEGKPSARMVLLKEIQAEGLVFFTNYSSKKGRELALNPHVAVTFFWPELERQIRVECTAQKISPEESDHYFYSRPKGSQAGAIVSMQSSQIDSARNLESEIEQLLNSEESLKRPIHWGGYLLIPNYFEFWHGRASRVHDRVSYQLSDEKIWQKSRLSP